MSLVETRLEIYDTLLRGMTQVAFNEIRLAADHTSRNDRKAARTIVTFRQARMLLSVISLEDLINSNHVVADLSRLEGRNQTDQDYLTLDSFQPGTKTVQKLSVRTRFLQVRYLEASWPADSTVHRLEPLPGSIRSCTKKSRPSGPSDDARQRVNAAKKYAEMLSRNPVVITCDRGRLA